MSELNEHVEYQADRLDAARKRFQGINIPGICTRCCYSHIFKTARQNDPTVLCTRGSETGGGFRVAIDISECNKFSQLGRVSVWDLAKLATEIDINAPRLGFTTEDKTHV